MSESTSLTALVVGSGGREHALAAACKDSPLVGRVLAAPGNPGIAASCERFEIAADDIAGLVKLAVDQAVDFVIVGPEVPLVLGLVDELESKGILAYGPKADGARLEGSKNYTKEILLKHKLPTGAAASFTDSAAAIDYLQTASMPIVIKADGLAAGKGVVIAKDIAEAHETVTDMIDGGSFGEASREVLIEECLFGEETSIHVIVSGRDYLMLPTSQDHKQAYEGDTGPNTGGMGAYSPADLVSPELLGEIERDIVKPSVEAIAAEGIDFRGTLFIGLMITKSGPKVLEFNTRFGDPETQALLPRLKTDPVELMLAAAKGELSQIELQVKPEYAMVVVLASAGYPGAYPKGERIAFPDVLADNEIVFHAGTAFDTEKNVVTSGGRVVGVTALAENLKAAADKAYALCDKIEFKSKYLRSDIGFKELSRES